MSEYVDTSNNDPQPDPTWNYHLSNHTECLIVGVPCWHCGRQYDLNLTQHIPDAYHQPDRTMEAGR
jgi:hypothetical protein